MDIPLDIQFVKINYSTFAHFLHHKVGWRDEWFRGRGVLPDLMSGYFLKTK